MDADREVLLLHIPQNNRHLSASTAVSTTSTESTSPSLLAPGDDIEDQRAWREQRQSVREKRGKEEGAGGRGGMRKWWALPAVVLVGLVVMLLDTGAGIAFSVLAALRSVSNNGGELPSRIVVFTACVISFVYVLVHLAAARTKYRKKDHGTPQLYGNYLHAAGLLLVRLGVPVWITAIVTTSLVVAKIGVDLSRPFAMESNQTIYINFLVSVVGLLTNCVLLFCVEVSSTPFATLLISKSSFLANREKEPMKEKEVVRIERTVSQVRSVRQSFQSKRETQSQHRNLNSTDRSRGEWPRYTSRLTISSSIYSNDAQERSAPNAADEDDGLGLVTDSPISPPAAPVIPPAAVVVSNMPANVPPIPRALAASIFNANPANGFRSPVHYSWRPPSHDRRSMDGSSRPNSRHKSIVPPAAVGVRGLQNDAREPTLPDVFGNRSASGPSSTGSGSTAQSSASSNVRMTWAPSPNSRRYSQGPPVAMHGGRSQGGINRQELGRRRTMVSPRSPFGTFNGGSLPNSYPILPKPPVPALQLGPHVAASITRSTNMTPSPRARSLRSHPPFAELAVRPRSKSAPSSPEPEFISPPPLPPPSHRPSPLPELQRPSTAPGPSELQGCEAAQELPTGANIAIKRKPVSSGSISSASQIRPSTAPSSESERETSPSRTARRVAKEREKEIARLREMEASESALRRAQTVNNFSRPLPRSKSLVSLHSRSQSDNGPRKSLDARRGGGSRAFVFEELYSDDSV